MRKKKRKIQKWKSPASLSAKQEVPTSEDEPKMSAVILELAKPMLDSYGTSEKRIRAIILHTVISWNASMLPQNERSTVDKIINAYLPKDATAEDVATIIDSMEIVSERRQRLYPNLRKLIMAHEVKFANGTLTLDVTSSPVPNPGSKRKTA